MQQLNSASHDRCSLFILASQRLTKVGAVLFRTCVPGVAQGWKLLILKSAFPAEARLRDPMSDVPGPGIKRMRRHIDEAVSSMESMIPCGPKTPESLFMWAPNVYDILKTEFTDARSILERKLWQGARVSSHYSGKGTAESCLSQIENVVRADAMEHGSMLGRSINELREHQFENVFACDKSPIARKALLGMRCQHVFGDLEDRVRPDLKKVLKMMEPNDSVSQGDKVLQHEAIKKMVLKASPAAFSQENTTYCYQCKQECSIWAGMKSVNEDAESLGDADMGEPWSIHAAGFSCTDWSRRRTTSLPKFAGRTAPVFWKWLGEVDSLRPHLVFWECSPFFEEAAIDAEMHDNYVQVTVVNLLGWPVTRLRKFGCLIRRDIAFLGSSEEFDRLFMRTCALDGDIFYDFASDEYILSQMAARAKARGYEFKMDQSTKPSDVAIDVMITPATYVIVCFVMGLFE